MKTLIYGFFIYVFLTTTFGLAMEKIDPKKKDGPIQDASKCNLIETISASEYVEECKEYTSLKGTKALPPFELNTFVIYLCTGIFETANRICELNVNSLPTNSTTLKNAIEKSQPAPKDLTKVCSAITSVISNSSYISTINYTTRPNIGMLNKYLGSRCKNMCWAPTSETSANSLCSILLWEIEMVVNSRAQSLPPANTPPPNKPKAERKPESNANQESRSGNKDQTTAKGHENETGESQVRESDDKVKDDKPKPLPSENSSSSKVKSNHPAKPKEDTNHDSKDLKNEDIPEEGNSNTGAKPAGSSQGGTPLGSGGESQTVEHLPNESNMKPEHENQLADKANEGAGDDKKLEFEPKEDLGDDEKNKEPEVPDNVESPPQTGTNPDSNLQNQIPASSNHESIAPRDHSIAHSGPLDPPQHFFAYFMAVSLICLLCYVGYHKKHKIMAIIFEGRKSRGGRGRRRPNTAGYRKLDCNLEEAVTSQCNSNVTHVIY